MDQLVFQEPDQLQEADKAKVVQLVLDLHNSQVDLHHQHQQVHHHQPQADLAESLQDVKLVAKDNVKLANARK